MSFKIAWTKKSFAADFANVRLLFEVEDLVRFQVRHAFESLVTDVAFERLLL